jgi:emp24/gp25L/p24 family/GOLD
LDIRWTENNFFQTNQTTIHTPPGIDQVRQGKDVSIAISQRAPFFQQQMNPDPSSGTRERPRNQREQPTEKEGTIHFETSPSGGPVQICVHSLFANKKEPYMIGLQVTQFMDHDNGDEDEMEDLTDEQQQQRKLQQKEKEKQVEQVLQHLSAFTTEMVRAESLVRTILASADVVKKEESDFYEQSIRMQKSVHFWPKLQLVCLVIAAIVQIRHVLNWMKSHHIY